MRTEAFEAYYFVGIGGIGMSALARYFRSMGKAVAGYDRTPTPLTDQLQAEGIAVHFDDNTQAIPAPFLDAQHCLVVYTPAIPAQHSEMAYFRANGFQILKRSQVLGHITRQSLGLAVAGTHGKTTVSTMLGHLLYQSSLPASAILGGIAINYQSNILLPRPGNRYTVVEADEFDRSLLQLHPHMAIVTALDADHLDIYGTLEAIRETFYQFIAQIESGGVLLHKHGIVLPMPEGTHQRLRVFTYARDAQADFYAPHAQLQPTGCYHFDLQTPNARIDDLQLAVPGWVNLENAIAAASLAHLLGLTDDEIRRGLASFVGIKRRMELHVSSPSAVYIDDYAHHPEELRAAIGSVRAMFPGRQLTGVFQPHLYSRTRDFAPEFAQSLDLLDRVVLLDIYPAREEPIEGVSAALIFDALACPHKTMLRKDQLQDWVAANHTDVLLTLGAGNIDQHVSAIKAIVQSKIHTV